MLHIGPYIIRNPYILAPMAGVSQMPFRCLALKMGAGLAPTELISAKGLFFANVRTKSYLIHEKHLENPFCVQLFGGEKESMAQAAQKAHELGAHIIDINMGCPVKKVTKTNAGSALLCDIKRACEVVQAMLKATDFKVPITAKIRSGWDESHVNYIEVGRALEDAGIAALALHARTRAQGYSGFANWAHIKALKEALRIPVIGNGDVQNLSDANRMIKETGCDAVMIGRAALGNPWVFSSAPMKKDFVKVIKEHLAQHIALGRFIAEETEERAFNPVMALKSFRAHLIWYSKGLSGGAKFRQEVMISECLSHVEDLIDAFFGDAEDAHEEMSDDGIDYRQAFG